jgi:2-polyprenyl-3-methyl-5-hydroxy-6-metoxy-1,4-benzoquinol methylase
MNSDANGRLDQGSPGGTPAWAQASAAGDQPGYYEQYWADAEGHVEFNFEAAVLYRFPSICRVWGSLKPPARVLDWGCGNGVLTFWMYENGFGGEVIGLDVSNLSREPAVRTTRSVVSLVRAK